MKKILLSCVVAAFLLSACNSNKNDSVYVYETVAYPADAGTAYYNDWDRALRVDVDMQNMFAAQPRKIETPIDLYMTMALAVKYNYSRRMASYEQAMLEAGKIPASKMPDILSKAGYNNDAYSSEIAPELKVTWNLLDMSTLYYQSSDPMLSKNMAYERSRKVIHNVLQETRALYWKTLMAQKLLPVMDEMIEFMTLEVDEMNIKGKALAETGKNPTTEQLQLKRKYMESIKELSSLKRDIETSESRLAALMGFHPSTQYKLVGKEYGNFALPNIKNNLADLEWLALTNRPEIRVYDNNINRNDLQMIVKEFGTTGEKEYKNNPRYYNRLWADKGREVGLSVFENPSNPTGSEMETLRRQRMSMLVLSQVYVSWARQVSAVEDYQINMEIAGISEDIAEDVTYALGSKNSTSHFEAARAIEDEAKAYRSYIEFQDSLGNLYSTIGLDALPYYVVSEKPSKIALTLRDSFERWSKGEYLPDNRPYLLGVPGKRPPINLSSADKLPDIEVKAGDSINVKIPDSLYQKYGFKGKITSKAGLVDDSPLPHWLRYNEQTRTLSGAALPSNNGDYIVKIYITDEAGKIGYVTFKIRIYGHYAPSIRVEGLTEGRKATVLKRCIGNTCQDDYINASTLGQEVEPMAY